MRLPSPSGSRGRPGLPPFALEVGRIALEEIAFAFEDDAVLPAAHLDASLRGELRDLVLDPARPGVPLALSLEARLADAGDFTLTGSVVPTGPEIAGELQLAGSSLTLASLAPYLAAAGFESTLTAGRLEGTARALVRSSAGGTELGAGLVGLRLADGDEELAALDELRVADVSISPQGDVRIGEVALAGLHLPASTDGEGVLHALGLAALPAASAATAAASGEPRASAPPAADAPRVGPPARIELARLSLADSDVSFSARHLVDPLDLALDGCELLLEDLAFGGDPARFQPAPARLRLATAIPGVAEGLELTGTLLSRPGELDVELDLDLLGRGLSFEGCADCWRSSAASRSWGRARWRDTWRRVPDAWATSCAWTCASTPLPSPTPRSGSRSTSWPSRGSSCARRASLSTWCACAARARARGASRTARSRPWASAGVHPSRARRTRRPSRAPRPSRRRHRRRKRGTTPSRRSCPSGASRSRPPRSPGATPRSIRRSTACWP